ncbi:MAG TPA: HD domain-containing protein [Kribbella sp.]|uniref:HD domain-containing protein n=1 Tax=Kribbella sp. TaxID=1871183 RepID=UPI002D79DB1D|nr:HD domain-containing protein [Kribbella sp.]HET6297010.1 HD domain-containing protein [Kribbella sp.]
MYDRIYGKVELPKSARKLAQSCPLLLRLREVRMPNIPFFDYPSFANVSRYEHSVGVGHLAFWWAKQNELESDSAEALALAGLYHDAATPAYSHLFEEFLSRDGFDHEAELASVLGAKPNLLGSQHAQVFLGRHCRLRDELAPRAQPGGLLSSTGVADLTAARHPLGVAVHGDLDLDNIDNVIRATTAMGLVRAHESLHPYEVALALRWDGEKVCIATDPADAVGRWRILRRRLYSAILDNEREFIAQATIKWALEECSKVDPELRESSAWTLTEPELVHEHLRMHAKSRELIDSFRLGRPAPLLLSAWIDDLSPLMGSNSEKNTVVLCDRLGALFGCDVYINFYVDKRERPIRLPQTLSPTLFDDVEEIPYPPSSHELPQPKSIAATPGVLGVIGTPRAIARNRDAKSTLITSAIEVLSDVLLQDVETADTRWLGTRRSMVVARSDE